MGRSSKIAGFLGIALLVVAAATASPAEGLGAPVAGSWMDPRTEVGRSEYRFAIRDGELQAPNRAHGLRSWVTMNGITVEPREPGGAGSDQRLVLSLVEMARGADTFVVGPGVVTHDGARAEILREGVTEWFVNDTAGLEHGLEILFSPVEGELLYWSTESECRNMGHFNHRLISKRGRESLDSEASRVDQDDTRLNLAEGLPSGRTSAPCDTATKASSLELRGFLQINNGQMVAPGQVRHVQLDPLATPPTHPCRRPSAWRTPWPSPSRFEPWCSRSRPSLRVNLIGSSRLQGTSEQLRIAGECLVAGTRHGTPRP